MQSHWYVKNRYNYHSLYQNSILFLRVIDTDNFKGVQYRQFLKFLRMTKYVYSNCSVQLQLQNILHVHTQYINDTLRRYYNHFIFIRVKLININLLQIVLTTN